MTTAFMHKTPSERLDYSLDFSRWLTDGDTINTATAVVGAGTTVVIDEVDPGATLVRLWIVGGLNGERGEITVTVVTTQLRTKQECFQMHVKDC